MDVVIANLRCDEYNSESRQKFLEFKNYIEKEFENTGMKVIVIAQTGKTDMKREVEFIPLRPIDADNEYLLELLEKMKESYSSLL